MTNALEIENLTKIYNQNTPSEKVAIKDINLNVPEGGFFALLGPNGAGKSTLINIIASLVIKTSGTVKILGLNTDSYEKQTKSLIGVVPQEVVMDTFFPVFEALEIHAGYYGVPKHLRKTEEILRSLGLWDKRNNTAKQLSGGMKRRFLVAKAMVHFPKILILDEPTAGVDIDSREQLWDYIKKLNREGTTIILTTHYLEEAQALCDKIAFINHGKIIKSDTKENLLTSLDAGEVIVEFYEDVALELLKSFDYIIISPHKIKISFRPSAITIGGIVSELQGLGLKIKDIATIQPDLNKVFKKIINQ